VTYQTGPGGQVDGQGGTSPSDPDGGDAPEPLDAIGELGRAPVRIGTPVHVVKQGNPSGAPCLPGAYMGFDGREAWVQLFDGRMAAAPYVMPGAGPGPVFTYGSFHLAARCEVYGPVAPPQQVAMPDEAPRSTDVFRRRT
jgi:hypothetical protein